MRVTISFDDEFHREAREVVKEHEITLSAVVEKALEALLAERENRPFRPKVINDQERTS